MADLTANKQRPVRVPPGGLEMRAYKVAGYTNFGNGNTAHTIFKGSVVVCDVSDTDGYVRAAAAAVNAAATDIFAGIAAERQQVTSSDLADGSKLVTCYVNGIWGFPVNGLAITDLGATVFATDDDLPQAASANKIAIGKLVDVDATYAWVDISDYAGKVSTETT
jgi:hypothetical protein